MNLETKYLGFVLHSPLVVSAIPLSQDIDNIKRMEDAGAGAVVLYSLFEEQIRIEQQILHYYREHPTATPADALNLFPAQKQFHTRRDDYLEHVSKAKDSVAIPIIASLNCRSLGNWTDFAEQIEQAGADALELNVYHIPANRDQTSEQIEAMYLTIARIVKEAVRIPVAIKLAPYFTNMAYMARRLDETGVNALVLFNRFFQPDLDPRTLELKSDIPLGNPSDLRLPLHWIASLYGHVKADLAATGGIQSAEDVVKMLMVGAKVTMLASAIIREGIDHLRTVEHDLCAWMDENDYDSIDSMQGILRQFHSKDTASFERGEYIRAITSHEAES